MKSILHLQPHFSKDLYLGCIKPLQWSTTTAKTIIKILLPHAQELMHGYFSKVDEAAFVNINTYINHARSFKSFFFNQGRIHPLKIA